MTLEEIAKHFQTLSDPEPDYYYTKLVVECNGVELFTLYNYPERFKDIINIVCCFIGCVSYKEKEYRNGKKKYIFVKVDKEDIPKDFSEMYEVILFLERSKQHVK